MPGRGDGTFEVGLRYSVLGSPSKILVGDLDGDAKRDLVVVSYDGAVNTGPGSVSVLHNDGAGTFSRTGDYAVGRTSFSPTALAALGDLNGDRKPDVVVDNPVDGSVSILVNNGDGTFAPKVDYPIGTIGGIASSLLLRDVNGDGKGDLVLARRMANVVSILLNNGDGTFAAKVDYPASLQAGSVVVEDLNGDGRPELVVLTGTTVTVFLNVINGAFVRGDQLAVGPQAREVAIGDVDGDGKKDLVVAGTDVGVLLGNGTGTFAPRVDYPGGDGALVLADLNGDGRNDVALVGPIVTVLLNAGAGALAPGVGYPGFGLGASGPVAVEDMNGDGRPDLVMGAVVLANTGAGAFGEPAMYSGIGTDTSSSSFGGGAHGRRSPISTATGDPTSFAWSSSASRCCSIAAPSARGLDDPRLPGPRDTESRRLPLARGVARRPCPARRRRGAEGARRVRRRDRRRWRAGVLGLATALRATVRRRRGGSVHDREGEQDGEEWKAFFLAPLGGPGSLGVAFGVERW